MEYIYALLLMVVLTGLTLYYFVTKKATGDKGIVHRLHAVKEISRKETIVLIVATLLQSAAFILGFLHYRASLLDTLRWQTAIGLIIPVAAIDLRKRIIPNYFVLIGLVCALVFLAAQILTADGFGLHLVGPAFIGALVGGGVFFLASLFVKDGIGAGDIKMFLMLGLLLALKGVFAVLLYSMVISALVSIVLLISRKRGAKDVLPLAPFTAIGVTLAIILGA